MIKKLSVYLSGVGLVIVGLMASDVSATERFRLSEADKTYPQGFYVGGYGGFAFPQVDSYAGGQDFDETPTGVSGGGFLGYRVLLPRGFYYLYFALESDIGVYDAEVQAQEGDVTVDMDVHLQYGSDVLFGYKDEAWLVFLRGGWQRTRFDSTFTDDADSVTLSSWENGIRFGGGVDYGMGRWFIRLDYRRVLYRQSTGAIAAMSGYRFKWSDNRTHFGIGYRF
ncbi:MAG: outer membrane beta-barrel protein [Alphaproteobacteria bacterium GM202ARS2]|nr:outer membrane beta-barrel protein [Alphaproteobacteria bacterium GM202ARS2]